METGKTDRRVQYTKRALTSALIDLMRENHISKISVKALCAAADVNRSTFYAHFRNQYDLLAYIEAEALEDLKARLLADGEPRTRNVEKILEYAKENADVFLMLLDESEGGFQRQIMELAHLVDLQMSDQDAAVDADDLEYMYLFAVSGALGMLSHWLKKGTPQSVDDLPHHAAINYLQAGRVLSWQLMDSEGASHTFTPRSSLNMDDLQAICDAALAGHGIAWLPCWMVSKEIHQGKLVPLLKQAPDVRFDVHAVWQQTPHLPLRVRIAVDTLASRLPSIMSLDRPAPTKKPR